ncbi:hypothetical protein ACQ86N_15850 [Puia sp. P3]|uniref:hypothetical protein n=1 Tax=Puia sp. P3 TaxID=3423952 RepID=UPI003D67E3CF
MKTLTQWDVEGLRGELFHMILFAMALVLIGEYSLDFKDYAAAAMFDTDNGCMASCLFHKTVSSSRKICLMTAEASDFLYWQYL